MATSTLLHHISMHESLIKIILACSLPLFVVAGCMLCFVARSLRDMRAQAADKENNPTTTQEIPSLTVRPASTPTELVPPRQLPELSDKTLSSASTLVDTPPLKTVTNGAIQQPSHEEKQRSSQATKKMLTFVFPELPKKPSKAFVSLPEPSQKVVNRAVAPPDSSRRPSLPMLSINRKPAPSTDTPAFGLDDETDTTFHYRLSTPTILSGYQEPTSPTTSMPSFSSSSGSSIGSLYPPSPPMTPALCVIKRSTHISSGSSSSSSSSSTTNPPLPSLGLFGSCSFSASSTSSVCSTSPLRITKSPTLRRLDQENDRLEFETKARIGDGIEAKVMSLRDSSPRKSMTKIVVDNDVFVKEQRSMKMAFLDLPPSPPLTPMTETWGIFKSRAQERKEMGLPCLLMVDGEDTLCPIYE